MSASAPATDDAIAHDESSIIISEKEIASNELLRPIFEEREGVARSASRKAIDLSDSEADSIVVVPESLPTLIHFARQRREVFLVSKKWEGQVISVDESGFLARLKDVAGPDTPIEETDFLLSEIDEDDKSLVAEGALFYFSVGHFVDETGNLSRQSKIRFRRFPNWDPDEILDARERAKKISAEIRME